MRTNFRILAGFAVAAVAAAPLLGVGGAAAAGLKPVPNASFAGYQVSQPTVSQASTTFVVPTITCKKSFSGVGPSVFVQTKADKKGAVTESGAGVGVACQNKQAEYVAAVIVNGTETNDYSLTPGDKVTATVQITAKSTKVDIKDLTSGDDKTASGDGAHGAVALIGDSAISFGTTSVGIDPFTKTVFKRALVDNKAIGTQGAIAIDRTHGKTVQIATSKLVAKKNFVLTFKNSK